MKKDSPVDSTQRPIAGVPGYAGPASSGGAGDEEPWWRAKGAHQGEKDEEEEEEEQEDQTRPGPGEPGGPQLNLADLSLDGISSGSLALKYRVSRRDSAGTNERNPVGVVTYASGKGRADRTLGAEGDADGPRVPGFAAGDEGVHILDTEVSREDLVEAQVWILDDNAKPRKGDGVIFNMLELWYIPEEGDPELLIRHMLVIVDDQVADTPRETVALDSVGAFPVLAPPDAAAPERE